jgi:uncharacterized protein (TIGR02569 family)
VSVGPPGHVMAAFGANGPSQRLPGGNVTGAWRVDDLVLKPVDNADEHAWLCRVYSEWPDDSGVRVPRPVASADGHWQVDGWGANRWLRGSLARVTEDPVWFRAAAERFHDVIAAIQPPGFLAERNDPWSLADRVVNGEDSVPALVQSFVAECLTGVSSPEVRQLVHGDLTNNILRDGETATVVDWPPYLWPRDWALAVVVVDALCWQGGTAELLSLWSDIDAVALRRALAWRVVTRGLREADPDLAREHATLTVVEKVR